MSTATETAAEVLSRAAKLMRERAEVASPGPWHQMCMGSEGCSVINDGHLRERKHVSFSGRKDWKADHADAEYVASWHPLVAAFVADWLDAEAAALWDPPIRTYSANHALNVARAYLGEPDA